MLNEYYKWSVKEDGQTIEHIGILTKENDDSVCLLTKYGEMTIMKNDGEFTESTREEFESVIIQPKEVEVNVEVREGSKSQRALDIYTKMLADGKSRKDIITAFKSQLDMGDAGASTYYQNCKKSTTK